MPSKETQQKLKQMDMESIGQDYAYGVGLIDLNMQRKSLQKKHIGIKKSYTSNDISGSARTHSRVRTTKKHNKVLIYQKPYEGGIYNIDPEGKRRKIMRPLNSPKHKEKGETRSYREKLKILHGFKPTIMKTDVEHMKITPSDRKTQRALSKK